MIVTSVNGRGSRPSPSLERQRRQQRLVARIEENPFLTDEELARLFSVSIQTIRLDRLSLGIPEVRQRLRQVADRVHPQVKSMASREIVGELIDMQLGQRAISILETSPDMAFERTQIVRGHHLFAQADSLAIAVVDADVVLTGLGNVKYKRPVRVGERLVAKAEVLRARRNQTVVLVVTTAGNNEQVFRAKFVVFALPREAAR